MDEGKVLPAEQYLRQAFDRAPDNPAVLESLGQLYLRAGRLAEAEQMFRAAVSVAPGHAEIHRGLAEVALLEGDPAAALIEIDVGRAGAVSGKVGLFLLDEGEIKVHLYAAEAALASDPPDVDSAGQSLTRADTLLSEVSRQGFEREANDLRTRWDDLRRRREELAGGL